MTDDELHFRLRDRSQRFWVTEQDLLDNMLFREAADRIEQLVVAQDLLVAQRNAAWERDTYSFTEWKAAEAKLKTAEEIGRAFEEDAGQLRAKLAKAVDVIKHIINIAPEGDDDEWHIALDDADALLAELGKTE
jgi:biopolymer transport protein ExbB/TolQ